MHKESYLDLYDRSELVYLSSDGNSVMDEYNKNITYIIGGKLGSDSQELPTFSCSCNLW